jgi:LmbE family N-acetylglucosaminyl deacetylase
MLRIDFAPPPGSIYRILCLGAHCDDIEIGCGGALLSLIQQYKQIECYWVVFSSNQQRAQEAYTSASCFLGDIEQKQIEVKQFRDGFLPYQGAAVKEQFEQIKQAFVPDIIFTHYRHDLHQDHRLIAELTWNTFRNHLILEYEIPKYDGDLGSPNVFFQLDQALCERKINYILESFPSQHNKHWFSKETFLALLRLRGMESAASGNYAEGFYCRKIVC